MTRTRTRLLAMWLVIAAGCDAVAERGQVIEATNGGSVWAVSSPNAVDVRPGGTLVVNDASLFGLGRVVTAIPVGPFPSPGAAIRSSGGAVQILKGTIAGGNVLVQVDPNSFPIPAAPGSSPGAEQFAALVGVPIENVAPLAVALDATNSDIAILGGTLIGSSVFGRPNPYIAASGVVRVLGGDLRISGGEFLPGTMVPPSPLPNGVSSLTALNAFVNISGGNFDAGRVVLGGANAQITAGSFGAGLVVTPLLRIDLLGLTPAVEPCYGIRGGSFSSISVSGADPVFIVGSQFNLPFGPVTSPAPPPGRTGPATPLALTGVFADGTPVDLDLIAPPGTNVSLVDPSAVACDIIVEN